MRITAHFAQKQGKGGQMEGHNGNMLGGLITFRFRQARSGYTDL